MGKYQTFKARRWVVELSHSWFNRFRKLTPRYEKTDLSYNALNALAAAMITLNKVAAIYRYALSLHGVNQILASLEKK